MTVLLAGRSMVAAIGGLCLILGQQDALLAVETRLWRWAKMRQNALQNGASAGAKHAGKMRRTCMLMMPGPSG